MPSGFDPARATLDTHSQSTASADPLLPPAALAARFKDLQRRGADPAGMLRGLSSRLQLESRDTLLSYARSFLEDGQPGVVAALLQDAAQRWPDDAELAFWLGNAHRMCGSLAAAEQVFRGLLQRQPSDRRAALALAHLLRNASRLNAAADVVIQLYEACGSDTELLLSCVQFLEGCRRFAEAGQLCEKEIARGDTVDPRLLFLSGEIAMTLGQFEQAHERVLAAIEGGLDLGTWSGVWLLLAGCQRYADATHPDLDRFRKTMADPQMPIGSATAAAFAYGKACDDLQGFEEAAQSFERANALARPRHPWSAQAWDEFVETCLKQPLPASLPTAADDSVVPIFVVGLPRSGTTLVAELLGRHPDVCNRGERAWIPYLNQQLMAASARNDRNALRQAAATYIAHIRQDDAPARWYIDKNPLNFRHLDLIAAMLPQARIIHCRRDRRDTALSIWMQHFDHRDSSFAYDWQDIASFASGERRLMNHWKKVLPLPVFTLDYETLAESPAQCLAELGAYLSLPQQDLLTMAPKEKSAIVTSSVWQARQPVYRSSVGRWRAYEPLIPQLAAWRDKS